MEECLHSRLSDLVANAFEMKAFVSLLADFSQMAPKSSMFPSAALLQLSCFLWVFVKSISSSPLTQ